MNRSRICKEDIERVTYTLHIDIQSFMIFADAGASPYSVGHAKIAIETSPLSGIRSEQQNQHLDNLPHMCTMSLESEIGRSHGSAAHANALTIPRLSHASRRFELEPRFCVESVKSCAPSMNG